MSVMGPGLRAFSEALGNLIFQEPLGRFHSIEHHGIVGSWISLLHVFRFALPSISKQENDTRISSLHSLSVLLALVFHSNGLTTILTLPV